MRLLGFFRLLGASIALCTAFAAAPVFAFSSVEGGSELPIATPPLQYYAPVPTYHDPIGQAIGVITSYIIGGNYGEAVIFDLQENEYHLIIGGDFLMEGRILHCEEAPRPDHPVTTVLCPDWPANITLDETPIIFTYWRAQAHGEQIAVLRSIDVVPSGYQHFPQW
jgi:hypothetical protein